MPHAKVFGRDAEVDAFKAWVAAEAHPHTNKPAALLIGRAGMGKSAVLRACEQVCEEHTQASDDHWYCIRAELNQNESAAAFLERLYRDLYRLVRAETLPSDASPHNRRLKRALLEAVPAAGKLLKELVPPEDVNPSWKKFQRFLNAVDHAIDHPGRNHRLVVLIDPDGELKGDHLADWRSLAKDLPPHIRILIAQRPDDTLAAADERDDRFGQPITKGDFLADLDVDAVTDWYADELASDDFQPQIARWPEGAADQIATAAHTRYQGHPIAYEAVLILLRSEPGKESYDPIARIQSWPRAEGARLHELMDMLLKRLSSFGNEHRKAALILTICEVPVPVGEWLALADPASEFLSMALLDRRFAHFFARSGNEDEPAYQPFHALFAERLARELDGDTNLSRTLAEHAWSVISPRLDESTLKTADADRFALAAAIPIALRLGNPNSLLDVVNPVVAAKKRFGDLDVLVTDFKRIRERCGKRDDIEAAVLGNMGNIAQVRGDLDEAMRLYSDAVEVEKRLGRLKALASILGNMGVVEQIRGDLDEAMRLHNEALELNQRLEWTGERKGLEGQASNLGNMGNIAQVRGDLDEAMRLQSEALQLNRRLGRLEGQAINLDNMGLVAKVRGDLDEAIRLHGEALELNRRLGSLEGQVSNLGNMGVVAEVRGDFDEAMRLYGESLELARRLERLDSQAAVFSNMGNIARVRGDLDEAMRLYGKALELNRRVGRLQGQAINLSSMGVLAQIRGDLDEAMRLQGEALELHRRLGSLEGQVSNLGSMGVLAQVRGDLDEAMRLHSKALKLGRRLGSLEKEASQLSNMGSIAQKRGDLDEAMRLYGESRDLQKHVGSRQGEANQLSKMGLTEASRGNIAKAHELWKLSLELFITVGARPQVKRVQRLLNTIPCED